LNTLGSCLGILFFTLVGYELPHDLNAYIIALGLLFLLSIEMARESGLSKAWRGVVYIARAGAVVGFIAILLSGWASRGTMGPGGFSYWGRDGVVEVRRTGAVFLDGLWHSRLSNGRSHIGDDYSWMMAVSAVFAHRDTPLRKALVVGNGLGLTAGTLARLPGLHVVAYEINHKLADLLADHPKGTLGVAKNPRIDIRWQDARSGLALDPARYDLIISAPMYLRQAGSSLLLSREYLELLKSRLNEDGVVALYAREGRPLQSLLVHRTVRSVFPHVQLLREGQIAVASRMPIEITRRSIEQRLQRRDPFYTEVATYDRSMHRGKRSLYDHLLPRRFDREAGVRVINDDHPLVEYPSVVARLVTPAGDAGAR
jgi:spermidine synthase